MASGAKELPYVHAIRHEVTGVFETVGPLRQDQILSSPAFGSLDRRECVVSIGFAVGFPVVFVASGH